MYQNLAQKLLGFRLLISTDMEKSRTWTPDSTLPNVQIQRSVSWNYQWRHPNGFREILQAHFPYDTIPILLKERPEVVISSELGARTAQALVYRFLCPATRLIIKATLSEVSEQGRGLLRKLLRCALLRHADAVLVNGESGARYIRRFGVPPERLFVVPSTTEMTAFAAVPLKRPAEATYRLLYVGQLVERKGLVTFFEVLHKWGQQNATRKVDLWVVGSGPLKSCLEGYVLPQNITVKFWGAVAYSELPGIYAQCGLLVFPTLADEWGMVVNEAMAAGLPVLGSVYSQAVEELVIGGVSGWIFRPDDLDDMYSSLNEALITSENRLIEMQSAARNRIRELTPESAATRVLDAVRYVCASIPSR